jgi:putative peptidoglycan lipid II flippase
LTNFLDLHANAHPKIFSLTKMSHIARSALIIAVFFGMEKLLGFFRQLIIARQFGLTAELDVFNAANNLPDLIFGLISGGALAVAFIPVLSEYLEEKGRPEMWDLFSRVANLVFLVTAGLSIVVALLASQLVGWNLGIAPGFNPEQQSQVVSLMRINLIATLLFSISGLVIAGLQANQHFLLPALARSMYDIGTLIGVIFLAPSTGYQIGPITLPALGLGIYGLAYGTVIGAILFLVIQLPGLVRYQFRWVAAINLRHPGVQKVLRLFTPRIGSMFFIYLVLIYIPDNIASRLPVGSVTALVYGWLFMQVPETLIGTAIGTALLPSISEQFVRHEKTIFTQSLNKALRVILAFTLPLSVLISFSIEPLVALFGFDQAGTELVVWTTRAFMVGLAGHAMLEIAARGFYAHQDAITPLWTSVLMAITFTILAVTLARRLGSPGIALANSLAFTFQALLLWYLLNRRFPGVVQVGSTLFRALLGSTAVGLAVYLLMQLPLPGLLVALGSLVIGGLVALPFAWPEIKLLIKL